MLRTKVFANTSRKQSSLRLFVNSESALGVAETLMLIHSADRVERGEEDKGGRGILSSTPSQWFALY